MSSRIETYYDRNAWLGAVSADIAQTNRTALASYDAECKTLIFVCFDTNAKGMEDEHAVAYHFAVDGSGKYNRTNYDSNVELRAKLEELKAQGKEVFSAHDPKRLRIGILSIEDGYFTAPIFGGSALFDEISVLPAFCEYNKLTKELHNFVTAGRDKLLDCDTSAEDGNERNA